jgi:hypothetical protein
MRLPNPIKLLPSPSQAIDVARQVAGLLPGLPGRGDRSPEGDPWASPPPPAPPPAPEPPAPAKPKPPKPADPKPAKPKADKPKPQPQPQAKEKGKGGKAKAGPGDVSPDPEPHHALNNPVGEPDPTAWPDPYDPDGGDLLDPHPAEDPDAQAVEEKRKRDKLDD